MLVKDLIKQFKEQWIDTTELQALPKTAEVTREFLKKNKISQDLIKKFDSMPLWEVRGIGPSKAVELWAKGVRPDNLSQYKMLLPETTLLALRYKPLDRIPHALVAQIAAAFVPKGEKSKCTVVGSFRRVQPTSGDVDILYVSSKDDLQRFLDRLSETHGKKWILFAQGPSKISGIFRYSSRISVAVDLWIATPENHHAMLLYSTGSKTFNVRMRFIAKRLGLKLNQYGLWDANLKLIRTSSERDIFDKLGMRYRKPADRN